MVTYLIAALIGIGALLFGARLRIAYCMSLALLWVGLLVYAFKLDHDVATALWVFFSWHAQVACLVAALSLVIRRFW